jgi:NADH-quinone oxidoreductase subunit I
MSEFARYLGRIASGAASLVSGMGVTIRYMFKPVVTVRYPRLRIDIPEGFRGPVELTTNPETGDHNCSACGTCARMCPSGVITVQGGKKKAAGEGGEGQAAKPAEDLFVITDQLIIDFSRCSLCGLCVESCPRKALRFSHMYEQCGDSRAVAVVDLIARQKILAAAGCAPKAAAPAPKQQAAA